MTSLAEAVQQLRLDMVKHGATSEQWAEYRQIRADILDAVSRCQHDQPAEAA